MIIPNNETGSSIPATLPNQYSLRILIADDEKRMVQLLTKNCQILGHRAVGIAQNGKEAVEMAKELQPDLLIMDIHMPEMDGIEAAATILKNQNLPIVMSTGAYDERTLQRVRHLGIGGYLVKPFSPAQLKVAAQMAIFFAGETGAQLKPIQGRHIS